MFLDTSQVFFTIDLFNENISTQISLYNNVFKEQDIYFLNRCVSKIPGTLPAVELICNFSQSLLTNLDITSTWVQIN